MRANDGYLAVLADVPLFEAMSRKDLRALAAKMTPVDVRAGREITTQGGGGSDFFVVLDGTAVVSKDGVALSRIDKGGFFGELALLVPHARTATVTAESDLTVGVLTRPEFLGVVRDIPSIAIAVMEQLAMLAMAVYPLHHTEVISVDLTGTAAEAAPPT